MRLSHNESEDMVEVTVRDLQINVSKGITASPLDSWFVHQGKPEAMFQTILRSTWRDL